MLADVVAQRSGELQKCIGEVQICKLMIRQIIIWQHQLKYGNKVDKELCKKPQLLDNGWTGSQTVWEQWNEFENQHYNL